MLLRMILLTLFIFNEFMSLRWQTEQNVAANHNVKP